MQAKPARLSIEMRDTISSLENGSISKFNG